MEGADGLKTGYTKEGGYGMVGSAVQNGTRLIVVVNGLEDPDDRADGSQEDAGMGVPQFRDANLCSRPSSRSAMPRCSAARAVRSSLQAQSRSR